MSIKLFRGPVAVIDTETTGFCPRSRVIEVAVVVLDEHGDQSDAYSRLVTPATDHWSLDAAATHGITRAELARDGIDPAIVAGELDDLLAKHGAMPTAFNVTFDARMLERLPWRPERWAPCIMARAHPILGRGGALKRFKNGNYQTPSLARAIDFFGVTLSGPAHRALTDALAAADVLKAVRRTEIAAMHGDLQLQPPEGAEVTDE